MRCGEEGTTTGTGTVGDGSARERGLLQWQVGGGCRGRQGAMMPGQVRNMPHVKSQVGPIPEMQNP
jgi:hypothetical protein